MPNRGFIHRDKPELHRRKALLELGLLSHWVTPFRGSRGASAEKSVKTPGLQHNFRKGSEIPTQKRLIGAGAEASYGRGKKRNEPLRRRHRLELGDDRSTIHGVSSVVGHGIRIGCEQPSRNSQIVIEEQDKTGLDELQSKVQSTTLPRSLEEVILDGEGRIPANVLRSLGPSVLYDINPEALFR
jgi:hypothetical protein